VPLQRLVEHQTGCISPIRALHVPSVDLCARGNDVTGQRIEPFRRRPRYAAVRMATYHSTHNRVHFLMFAKIVQAPVQDSLVQVHKASCDSPVLTDLQRKRGRTTSLLNECVSGAGLWITTAHRGRRQPGTGPAG
jgi:hypothetical protein